LSKRPACANASGISSLAGNRAPIPEERKMPGATARRDTRADRLVQAADAAHGQRVEVGRAGCLELGCATGFDRQSAQAVQDQQDDLGIRWSPRTSYYIERG
jgi:hypothetical protein